MKVGKDNQSKLMKREREEDKNMNAKDNKSRLCRAQRKDRPGIN